MMSESPSLHVMLRRDWGGPFRRSVVDANGKRLLLFNPGNVTELTTPEEIAAIQKDLGKALLPVVWSDRRREFVVADADSLAEVKPTSTTDVPLASLAGDSSTVTKTEDTVEMEKVGPGEGESIPEEAEKPHEDAPAAPNPMRRKK